MMNERLGRDRQSGSSALEECGHLRVMGDGVLIPNAISF
jgi:hypothetical protein